MKPKQGDCGTCHWWEYAGMLKAPNGDEVRNGFCCVNPPVPFMTMQQAPGSALSGIPPRVVQGVQGMLPPQTEFGRCEKWRAYGAHPLWEREVINAN